MDRSWVLEAGCWEAGCWEAGMGCAFKTPNGMINNTGMLDLYKVSREGSSKTFDIYINMYDKGDLLIPMGFTARNN